MTRQSLLTAAMLLLMFESAARGAAKSAEPGAESFETRVLADAGSAKQWSTAESTLEASNARTRTGKDVLLWHIGVDHFTGEPNYPIGWPRIGLSLRNPRARDWSDWDYLQMWIYTDTSRRALPREPAGLSIQAPDRQGAYNQPLRELKKGQWVQIRVPLEQIPRRDDVRLIQLHISESNYRHLDKLDFYLDEVALLRYARPTLLECSLETAVAFADCRQLAVRFNVAGVKAGEVVEVDCELRHHGKIIARTAMKASRGPQRMLLDLAQTKLQSGEYEVLARAAGGADMPPLALRLVESPWQQAE